MRKTAMITFILVNTSGNGAKIFSEREIYIHFNIPGRQVVGRVKKVGKSRNFT